jgi:lysophospholipase L1-like esterase
MQRRYFIKNSLLAATLPTFGQIAAENTPLSIKGENTLFLFQGDSITDGNRGRNNDLNHILGHGYVFSIASKLGYDLPQKAFHFVNKGISGNKITDLATRWEKEALDIKPQVLSILIGVNDTSSAINGKTEFTKESYENGYRALLKQTKAALPDVQLVICEPFILPVGRVKAKWTEYSTEIAKRQAVAAALSKEFDAVFVPFQTHFNAALKKAPADYWMWDGIHPMPAGHELMAREWLKVVSKKLRFLK